MKSPKNPHVIEREFLVAFDGPESAAKRGEIFAKYGVKEREKVGGGHLYLVETPEGLDAKQFREQLGHEAGVRYVEPNLKMRIMPMKTGGGPDDPQ